MSNQKKVNEINNTIFSKAFILVIINQFLFSLNIFTFQLLPKYMAIKLNSTAVEIGYISAAFGIAIVVGMALAGIFSDRYGRRPFLISGSLLCSISSICYLLIDHVGILFYITRILQGFAFAFSVNAAGTICSDLTPSAHLSRALGFWGASIMAANGIAPYTLEIVSESYSWNVVFISAAVFGLSAFFISLFIKESAIIPDDKIRRRKNKNSFLKLSPIMLSLLTAGGAYSALITYYQPFALKLGIKFVGGFFAGLTLCVIIVRVFLTGFADRFGRKRVSVFSLLIYGVAACSMAWLKPGMLEIIGSLLGLAHGLFYPAITAYAVDITNGYERGRTLAFTNGSFNVGFTLSAFLLGPLVLTKGYSFVFILSGLIVFTSIAALLFIKENK